MPNISILIVYYLQSFKSRILRYQGACQKPQEYVENENTEEEGIKDHLLVIGDAGENTVGSGSEYETVRSLDTFAHPRRPLHLQYFVSRITPNPCHCRVRNRRSSLGR